MQSRKLITFHLKVVAMISLASTAEPDSDAGVDLTIRGCMDPASPKSFFLYAGAGSGKTYSLVEALKEFRIRHGKGLRIRGQKIAVITYTNAARDEIVDRVDKDSLFDISTIHSFCWSQIKTFHSDIRNWLIQNIPSELSKLREEEERGRPGSKRSLERQRSIASKESRLEWLQFPRQFTYNPNGENSGRASLSHSEVLKITADFLISKPTMQCLLQNRYPFLLIDESQDTNRHLIEALFVMEKTCRNRFALGLFGDTMQRIYSDGKPDLGVAIPDGWAVPAKRLNRRCPRRLVTLANDIRASVDTHAQIALEGNEDGIVRVFIARSDTMDKAAFEADVARRMAEITGDEYWGDPSGHVKSLTLEHRMSARRMGFDDMFAPLYSDDRLSTGVLDGTLSALKLFTAGVKPLMEALVDEDEYRVMSILRSQKSSLLEKPALKAPANASAPLEPVRKAIKKLRNTLSDDPDVSFHALLQRIAADRLFPVPRPLLPFVEDDDLSQIFDDMSIEDDTEENMETGQDSLTSFRNFLDAPYQQIHAYLDYLADEGPFDTHQGVKGLEFDRVLVVMDDSEMKGFSFSYEKLFDAKPLSSSDEKKLNAGEEIGLDRTRRLFYVTCTRAKKSLALVAYTEAPSRVASSLIEKGWFDESEIVIQ